METQNKVITRKKKTKKPNSKKTTDTSEKNEDICFTIMPFGGWFDDYYTSIYCQAIEDAGLTPCRADDLYRPSTIVHDIWSYTKRAKLILADLTGKNPNVFYELGLAHALAKPAILVVENLEDVPFDLRALRVIEYDKNEPKWGDILKVKIKNAIKEVLEAPTQSVLPAFLNVIETGKKTTVTEREKELIELRQDIDMLRRELRIARSENRSINLDDTDVLRYRDRHRRLLEPEAADILIRQYMESGLPNGLILKKISAQGVPIPWIKNRLRMIDREKASSSKKSESIELLIPDKE